MAEFLASFVSDAHLLGCVLRRLGPRASLGDGERAAGVGFFNSDEPLVRKRPLAGAAIPDALADGVESDVALVTSGAVPPPGGAPRSFHEDTTLPLRARGWLFSVAGRTEALSAVHEELFAAVPEPLLRGLKGEGGADALFFTFLARLRDLGRIDDLELEPQVAARALAAAVGGCERAFEAKGLPMPALAAVATNGRLVAALRRGHPLWTWTIDGMQECARHEVGPRSKEHQPGVRAHRAMKGAVLLSGATPPEGFAAVPEGGIVAVGPELAVTPVG